MGLFVRRRGSVSGASRQFPPSLVLRSHALFLVAACSAAWPAGADALEELWCVDLVSASHSLPLPVDYDGDGQQEVFFTTRFDGTVWRVSAQGRVTGQYQRAQWLEGSMAATAAQGHRPLLMAYQESTGRINLADFRTEYNVRLDVPGAPQIGTMPCFADLNRNGRQEVVVARRNGVIVALDRNLNVLWQYNGGAPFHSSPAAAPIFHDGSALFAQSEDGILHGIHGNGRPLWRFQTEHPAPPFPSRSDPLAVELQTGSPCVLVSDEQGWLYAVDAANGREHWRAQAGSAPLGSPAAWDLFPSPGLEVLTLSERGELAILNSGGILLRSARLPEGRFVPRPLLADVDADGALEVLVATNDWRILVATLDGAAKKELKIQGSALEGLVLSDVNGDDFLELLAVTDSGRAYCFSTRAESGWTHPRGGVDGSGCVRPVTPSYAPPEPGGSRRLPRSIAIVVPDASLDAPYSTASIGIGPSFRRHSVVATVRSDGRIVGSAGCDLGEFGVTVPFVQMTPSALTLDLVLFDVSGKPTARYAGVSVQRGAGIPIVLPPREAFAAAITERGESYRLPKRWDLPRVGGRDSWSVARYMPEQWERFGLEDEPFIRDAIPRIAAPASNSAALFRPGHPAWDDMTRSDKPFFLMNEHFRPTYGYPLDAMDAVRQMAGDRFLGFQVHEWAYRVWKHDLEAGVRRPTSREQAIDVFRDDFRVLMERCHDRIYAGEGYCVNAHHMAYAWGAPFCYAEIGENIPCAPMQFAYIRGAARQYGGKPWGAYISNGFRSAVLDTRSRSGMPRLQWRPEGVSGPDCGHSASLEYRLAMAAHMAGATFIHHESDARHGSIFVKEDAAGLYSVSEHGEAYRRWYEYATQFPKRGVPYTPIAFLIDKDSGWRPRERVFGLWPQGRAETSMEHMLKHVYSWDGNLDFERGYLSNGPYGDLFDVITNAAEVDVMVGYGVVWPLGNVTASAKLRRRMEEYVDEGGIVVVDSATSSLLPAAALGANITHETRYAIGIQTPLGPVPPVNAPIAYHPIMLGRHASPLAWTDTGEPLLAWHKHGDGIVIVSGTIHWLDEAGQLTAFPALLLRMLAGAFTPVSCSADVQLMLNRTEDGWIVALINNNGVSKVPTLPEVVDPDEARECLLAFRGRPPLSFESRLGEFNWSLGANGLITRIGPGEVAVVEVRGF